MAICAGSDDQHDIFWKNEYVSFTVRLHDMDQVFVMGVYEILEYNESDNSEWFLNIL